MNDDALYTQWVGEVYEMRDRIRLMRQAAQKSLTVILATLPNRCWFSTSIPEGMD